MSIKQIHGVDIMGWFSRKKGPSRKKKLARKLYNNKQYKKSEIRLLSLLHNEKEANWAMEVLTRLYMNTKQYDKSLDFINDLLKLEPSVELQKRAIKVGCISKQIAPVSEFLSQIPWNPDDEDLLIEVYKKFRTELTIKNIFLSHDWPRNLIAPHFIKAEIHFETGDRQKAEFLIQNAKIDRKMSENLFLFCQGCCEKRGLTDVSQSLSINFLSNIKGEVGKKKFMLSELIRSKRFSEAIHMAETILSENPDNEFSLDVMIRFSIDAGLPTKAILAFKTLDAQVEPSMQQIRSYAIASIQCKKPQEIHLSLSRLIELGANADATIRTGIIELVNLGETGLVEQILSCVKGSPLQFDLKASLEQNKGKPEQAIEILEQGLLMNHNHISFLMRKANILSQLNRGEECIAVCDEVLSINPQHLKASILRTQIGTKIWPEDVVVSEYIAMIDKFPECEKFYHQLLNYAYSGKSDMKWSLEIIERGQNHVPNDLRLKFYKPLVLAELGEVEQAKIIMVEVLNQYPSNDNVLIAAAQVEKLIGNPEGQLRYVNNLLLNQNFAPLISSGDNKISPEFLGSEDLKPAKSSGKVSVIMTAYKRDPLIDVAINSILNQTYRDLELIVVDDNSPDDNFAYLQQLAKEESRIRVFQMKQNGGTYLAKNFGLQQAEGEYFAFMDSDDFAHPQKIERQIEAIQGNPNIKAVVHRCIRIDEFSNIEFRGIGPFRMSCISLLIRREVVDVMGYFDSLRVGADTEFIERIDAVFGKGSLFNSPELTLFMTRHSTSLTGGGPFHISWRSITPPRLIHHTNFRLWHQQVVHNRTEGYISSQILNRPFEVPEVMKAPNQLDGGI